MEQKKRVLIVEPESVDIQFSLNDLMRFSKEHDAKVIIRGQLTLEAGGVSWLKNE